MEVTTEQLISVRDKIELMPKFNHVEILKILKIPAKFISFRPLPAPHSGR